MKKTILGVLIIMMITLMAVSNVYAANVTADKTTLSKGEEVVVTVKTENSVKGMQFTLKYDADKFEYVEASSDIATPTVNAKVEGTLKVIISGTELTESDFVKITFKAKENTEASSFVISNTKFVNVDETVPSEEVKVAQVTVKVEDKKQEPGDLPEDNKPEDNKPEDNKPEDNKPEDNKPEDNKPEDNKPEDNKPEDNKPEDNKPEDNKPEDNNNNDNNADKEENSNTNNTENKTEYKDEDGNKITKLPQTGIPVYAYAGAAVVVLAGAAIVCKKLNK